MEIRLPHDCLRAGVMRTLGVGMLGHCWNLTLAGAIDGEQVLRLVCGLGGDDDLDLPQGLDIQRIRFCHGRGCSVVQEPVRAFRAAHCRSQCNQVRSAR